MKAFLIPFVFALSLGSMFSGCQPRTENDGQEVSSGEKFDYSKFVSVGVVDPAKASHVVEFLDSNGVSNIVEGSAVYGVSVEPSNKEKAIALLEADSSKAEYYFEAYR